MTTIEQAVETAKVEAHYGRASAVKRGRNPRWPYVPVIIDDPSPSCPRGFTTQIRGLAFETRVEAVEAAQAKIDRELTLLGEKLAQPGARALREKYGLPREIGDVR